MGRIVVISYIPLSTLREPVTDISTPPSNSSSRDQRCSLPFITQVQVSISQDEQFPKYYAIPHWQVAHCIYTQEGTPSYLSSCLISSYIISFISFISQTIESISTHSRKPSIRTTTQPNPTSAQAKPQSPNLHTFPYYHKTHPIGPSTM